MAKTDPLVRVKELITPSRTAPTGNATPVAVEPVRLSIDSAENVAAVTTVILQNGPVLAVVPDS